MNALVGPDTRGFAQCLVAASCRRCWPPGAARIERRGPETNPLPAHQRACFRRLVVDPVAWPAHARAVSSAPPISRVDPVDEGAAVNA